MTALRLAINGAAGRMGQRLVALGSADPTLKIAAALEYAGHAMLGRDSGPIAGVSDLGVPLTATLDGGVDALIDFSTPAGAESATKLCTDRGIPLVMATTGLTAAQQQAIRDAAGKIPVVWAPSMSFAVNIAMKLVDVAGRALRDHPSGADVEIIERHHRYKEDAPSGTALKFGEIVAAAMGHTAERHGREGRVGKRPHEEIGYHAVRTGDNPGEHTIVFGMLGETIELRVAASNRDCYAQGAILAAKWLVGKPAGMYGMKEVLGL